MTGSAFALPVTYLVVLTSPHQIHAGVIALYAITPASASLLPYFLVTTIAPDACPVPYRCVASVALR